MPRFLQSSLLLSFLLFDIAPTKALEISSDGVNATLTCLEIENAISSLSAVSFPGTSLYIQDNTHWANSSSEASACAVEPGSVEDVSTIITIVGNTQTPFSIKGGGHGMNPGFSSTTGVQISMTRFSNVTYHPNNDTVDIGTGLIWDDVYAALEPLAVNTVGGRVSGVGVGGFSLGGGYSYLSNQHGLTIDNILAYELVLPNGQPTLVTNVSNPDLFFGLKGGFNNFGIVTKISLKTFSQGQVWGGLITYSGDQIAAVTAATANFSANSTDPNAQILTGFNFGNSPFQFGTNGTQPIITQQLFYNEPTPPDGLFDAFLAIPALSTDISTRSFLSIVQAAGSSISPTNLRGRFHTVSLLDFTPGVIAQFWGTVAENFTGGFVSYVIEPFLSSYFSNSQGGAYPHNPSLPLKPINLYFAWADQSADDFFVSGIEQSASTILNQALAEGQAVGGQNQIDYPNYALADTPLPNLYGNNVARLQSIKNTYDPLDIMGLAGGFKF